ncbi:uncharacterized protein LOC143187634 isoform X2 [Calliopsis andreniformis]|uniref:uncharacterized protein LOC143187634 isoform X2 n=1 Tax=Calliopsis andreniformis TaxID=337506 RepID=UPI003FCE9957
MSQECSLETLPTNNLIWLKIKEPLCNTIEENDSNTILTEDINKEIYKVTQTQIVENLSLQENQVPELPNNFAESLTNLVYLNLSNNQLSSLPNSLSILNKLVYLNLDYNKFVCIPNVICELKSLKTLTARGNCNKSLPQQLTNLPNLENLDLSFNNLNNLPTSYENLNCLQNLSLANNKFKAIPECVAKGMYNLKVFNFSQNICSKLNISPKSTNLIAFYAEKNNICPSFPSWILNSKYNKLEIVSLNETRFEAFNLPEKPSISCIKKLFMKQCKIFETTVERLIAGMTRLEQLIIGNSRSYYGNSFWCLPIESLQDPSCLKEIDVSQTGIPMMPRTINNFINLSKVDMSCNNMNWLPDEICCLKNLTSFIVHKNQIAMLPSNIGEMVSLKEFKISYNNLYQLPESMKLLNNLQYLDLYNNEFETVPEVIEKLSSLIGLDLEQNYFSTDGISLNRDTHYESTKHILRNHWHEDNRRMNGTKPKPIEEPETFFEDKRQYSTSSSSSSEDLSDGEYMCSLV